MPCAMLRSHTDTRTHRHSRLWPISTRPQRSRACSSEISMRPLLFAQFWLNTKMLQSSWRRTGKSDPWHLPKNEPDTHNLSVYFTRNSLRIAVRLLRWFVCDSRRWFETERKPAEEKMSEFFRIIYGFSTFGHAKSGDRRRQMNPEMVYHFREMASTDEILN